jgi:hypothetical protein
LRIPTRGNQNLSGGRMVAATGAASCLLDPARLLHQDTADPGRERASGDISVGPAWEF